MILSLLLIFLLLVNIHGKTLNMTKFCFSREVHFQLDQRNSALAQDIYHVN